MWCKSVNYRSWNLKAPNTHTWEMIRMLKKIWTALSYSLMATNLLLAQDFTYLRDALITSQFFLSVIMLGCQKPKTRNTDGNLMI